MMPDWTLWEYIVAGLLVVAVVLLESINSHLRHIRKDRK